MLVYLLAFWIQFVQVLLAFPSSADSVQIKMPLLPLDNLVTKTTH